MFKQRMFKQDCLKTMTKAVKIVLKSQFSGNQNVPKPRTLDRQGMIGKCLVPCKKSVTLMPHTVLSLHDCHSTNVSRSITMQAFEHQSQTQYIGSFVSLVTSEENKDSLCCCLFCQHRRWVLLLHSEFSAAYAVPSLGGPSSMSLHCPDDWVPVIVWGFYTSPPLNMVWLPLSWRC